MNDPTLRADIFAEIIQEASRIQHACADALRVNPSRSERALKSAIRESRNRLAELESKIKPYAGNKRMP